VIDVVGEGLRAAATRSALAYPLVFAAGLATSIGPCAAPRYVAVAALAHGARRPWAVMAAFASGVVGAYVALGLGAGMLGALWSASSTTYAVLAIALAAGGVVTLLRTGSARCPHNADAHRAGNHHTAHHADGHSTVAIAKAGPRTSAGGTFLLGAASAVVVSPCCTPVLAAIGAATMASGPAANGAALLGAFACGHVIPILLAGALGTHLSSMLRRWADSQAPAIVAGSLMLALAAYYGVLA
jgi:cytochrome c-type biogenesis protein